MSEDGEVQVLVLYKVHSQVVKTSQPQLEENIRKVFSDVLPQGELLLKKVLTPYQFDYSYVSQIFLVQIFQNILFLKC